jgi:general secretion pathway protein G
MRFFRHSRKSGNPSGLRATLRRRLDSRFRGNDEEGFTLVELMVVIVILGLLATIVIINVMPAADRAAVTKARADIATLEQAIEMYRLDNQRYPTSEEGLQALVSGEYIRRLPNDPWSNPYRYAAPGQSGRPFTVATWGADGREGGTGENADIAN